MIASDMTGGIIDRFRTKGMPGASRTRTIGSATERSLT